MAKAQKTRKVQNTATNTTVSSDPVENAKAVIAKMPEGTSLSEKIRSLAAAGYERPVIAKAVDRRYQHVRNVLITPLKRGTEQTAK